MSLPTFGSSTTAEEAADVLSNVISGKNVLVTGTSLEGIGFETARAIAKHAALVVITGYNKDRLQLSVDAIRKDKPAAQIRPLVLNLASLSAIRETAKEINGYAEPIHVVIHNAADTSGVYSVTADDIEGQMAVAHFGPFLLTKLILPKILASKTAKWTPRIVLVSSLAHSMGPGIELTASALRKPATGPETSYFLRYHEAKSANVLFALGLANRGAGKLRAYSLHPGAIYTNVFMKDTAIPMLKSVGLLNEDATPNTEAHEWKTIPQGASTSVVAAFDPRLDDKSGAYLVDGAEANAQRAPICSELANADKLWKLTEEILGEEFVL
ncbi:hypothetical protein MIND_00810200 [Mycena indigotica]|uniref:Short-chain dehydrogenase n=1 Tax=Mycena indigotica TaxID=2126181 RepID=A0A8H6SH75_9AGAR|nr:uncharacterized protein MIND_00810200 [Mycena indigotica]KAF7298631.1 hypothetical protein MIND_00810200 [Mycena indigotica]